MSDQVANKGAAAEQSRVLLLEMPPTSLISSSDKLLSSIAIPLFILVAGVLTVFWYYASSICITVGLAGFLRSWSKLISLGRASLATLRA